MKLTIDTILYWLLVLHFVVALVRSFSKPHAIHVIPSVQFSKAMLIGLLILWLHQATVWS